MTAAGGWLSDVTFWVDGVPSGGTAPSGGGGAVPPPPSGGQGFSLSREEAEEALREFKGIYDDLVRMEAQARQLREMRPAAEDPASLAFHETIVGGAAGPGAFGYGHGHVLKEIEFFGRLVARLEKALGLVTESDEEANQQISSAGGSLPRHNKGLLE
ncbi:hypothetical protein [Saccharomonospora xinjiangensis]|uniref:Uncharacterized protein n=1 Tax=Saccharomonospora xinjiangensis XJ-54 TaxID=882086 RepID=I0V3R0_9PSEU|nr:hypothetical protein [Saccharomonospora xinjiangensis]EID54763.1 hypothetical protein SacxiDRAFT_2541 [Saccharomonospora xinjiangensis XJ-54]